ncbi:trichohyalin isoform X2 [Nematostella vectensis]|uniref:trichohyalin isoform X2 n=1 Tax=Nematostella vectensis TaxID=45351 RepID=UPI0020771D92|nr:trichohyalin isoform X2 [Nematostella vectensis]
MVLPFDRQPLLHKRYANLAISVNEKPASSTKSPTQHDEATGDEYANFLRSLASGERQDDAITRPIPGGGKPAQASSPRDTSPSKHHPGSSMKSDGLLYVTLVAQQNEKDHKKKMRVIEDHMLQHKQEERELKRAEGDIIKKQHHLRRVMHEYENTVYKKRRGEEVRLSENNNDIEKIKQQHAIQEDRATKARIERNMSATLKMKDKQRKATLVNTSTEFNYHKVAKQLQLTRNEVARLTAEFEANLKKKEDEEFRLKKELADLSISLNMETQKKRTMVVEDHKYKKDTTQRDIQEERRRYGNLEDKLKQQSGQGVKHEYTKRRLSRDLINTKDSLSLKGREEGRKMTDVTRRLQHNSTSQRQAKLAAEYLELDRQGKEIEERGQFAEARRNHMLDQVTTQRKHQNTQAMTEWKKRFLDKENEASRRAHEDNVRHLQKIVSKLEESEHALYNRVRAAEMQRRKQEQIVTRLSTDFDMLRRDNARKIKETAVQCHKKEVEIEQKLLREKAELNKLLSQREEAIQVLNFQRGKLSSDKYMLSEEEREHNRIARIGQRTDQIEQDVS